LIEKFIDLDELYLFNQGELFHSYLKFGAHIVELNQQRGVHFALWAPFAKRVSVVGNFNEWHGHNHHMRLQGKTGVWTLFIPELAAGEVYKYEIESEKGEVFLKADPFAFYAELRPQTASLVYSLENYSWRDQAWLDMRMKNHPSQKPFLIYEVHAGSWKWKSNYSSYTYRELAHELVPYLKDMGYTHLELLPLMEHPYDGSWGYQITGYYAATSRYGTPHDLMYLIDQCHLAGIGVILDWVPGHFCKDAHGLAKFDGTALYESEEHQEWGTYKFDFARTEVWSFLISNALFWLDKYHIDGLRVDGITSMILLDFGKKQGEWQPNRYGENGNLEAIEFLRLLNQTVKRYYPDVWMIAEESTDWPRVTGGLDDGGLGFDYKWNMGWMNDTLRYMSKEFSDRKNFHNLLTFSMMYAFSENFILPFSHDEVVHGKKSLLDKMPGDYWQKFAGLRLLFLYQYCHPGAKLLFMGSEFGQFIEWRYYDVLEWFLLDYEKHHQLQDFVRALNKLYQHESCLWAKDKDWSGFEWCDVHNTEQSIVTFFRKGKTEKEAILVVLNFQPLYYEEYRIGVPGSGYYQEILNSDGSSFGGSGQINQEILPTEDVSWNGKAYSIKIKIPPLAGVLFKYCFE